jgi:hypothetical protein
VEDGEGFEDGILVFDRYLMINLIVNEVVFKEYVSSQ